MSLALCGRFHVAVELIGRRWSGAVIHILLQGRSRYGELRASIPDISDRMLSERLRELEEAGIIARTVIPDTPVRVEYALTDKGRALKPALDAIGSWAEHWVEAPPPAADQGKPAGQGARVSAPDAKDGKDIKAPRESAARKRSTVADRASARDRAGAAPATADRRSRRR